MSAVSERTVTAAAALGDLTLTESTAYIALFSYPLTIIFFFNWWGAGPRWAREHHTVYLPPELKERDERSGRFLLIFKYIFVLALLRLFVGNDFRREVALSSSTQSMWSLVVIGAAVAIVAAICKRLLALNVSLFARAEAEDDLRRGPSTLWFSIFAFGAFSEEIWRALCISGLTQNGYRPVVANVMTAFAFSIAHLSGVPARIPPGIENVGAEVLVGLMFGGMFIGTGSVIAPITVSISYYTLNFIYLRKRYARTDPKPEN